MNVRQFVRSIRPTLARILGASGHDRSAFDMLEARQLLSGGPLPTLADLESPNNTVVRLETNFGDIDFELFNSAAPITVANFLNYVTSGRLDGTFFHRSAFNNSNPFVLQGGGFTISDTTGVSQISTDAPIVKETTGRSNLQRTVAMARTSVLDSATSQFFINYVDNTFLDTNGGGYAVFARVIGGWNNVLAIQGLRSLDLTARAPFQGSSNQSIGGEVPVSNDYVSGTRLNEIDAVVLINAEVIKPATIAGFFNQRLYMPEGFRSGATTENLEIVNPNSVAAGYQVIARYETGIRDTVIASGTLSANTSLEIKLSDALNSALNTVRTGVPYALVIETALPSSASNPQPIAASVNRADFGSDTGEGLFNTTGYTDSQLRSWLFPRIERSATSREYLTWVNLSDQTATITVDFLTTGGSVQVTRTLLPYRRGGLEVYSLGLATGNLSAKVTSDQNIVAFLSDWDLPTGSPTATAYTPGIGVMGSPGGGTNVGALPDAVVQTGFTNTLSIYNPGSTVAVVTLNFWRASRGPTEDPITATRIIFAGGREDYALDTGTLGIPVGEHFSVTYSSGSAEIGVQWTALDNTSRGLPPSNSARPDAVSVLMTGLVAPSVHFGDGALDVNRTDGSMTERVSLFNPFADSGVTYSYTVTYSFSDGTTFDAFTGTIAAHQRVDHLTSASTAVVNKIGSGTAFRHYSVSVRGSGTNGSTTTNAVLAQFTRLDTTQGKSVASYGSAAGLGLELDNAVFQPAP